MRACSRCDVLSASTSFVSPSSVPSTAITRSPMRSNPPAAAVPSEGMRSTLWDVLETLTPIDPCESSATMIRSQSSPDSVMRLFVSSTGPISRCWRVIPSAVWMRSSGLVRTLSGSASLVAARDVWVRRDVWRRRCGAVDMAPRPWWRSAQPTTSFDTPLATKVFAKCGLPRETVCGSILPNWQQLASCWHPRTPWRRSGRFCSCPVRSPSPYSCRFSHASRLATTGAQRTPHHHESRRRIVRRIAQRQRHY